MIITFEGKSLFFFAHDGKIGFFILLVAGVPDWNLVVAIAVN